MRYACIYNVIKTNTTERHTYVVDETVDMEAVFARKGIEVAVQHSDRAQHACVFASKVHAPTTIKQGMGEGDKESKEELAREKGRIDKRGRKVEVRKYTCF